MAQNEILKMLAVSAVNVDRVPGGGVPTLVASDVAAMLAGASRQVMMLAYAKYLQDQQSLVLLASHVYCWSADLAVNEQWRITRGRPIVRNMSHLAVAESIHPNVCLKCCGRGFVRARGCGSCQGSGYKSISDCGRAKVIGVSKSTFHECWRDRYQQIYGYLQQLESDLSITLYKNNHEEELILQHA